MKKFFLTTMVLLLSLGAMAQNTADRTLQLYYGGEIIYSRAISLLDSLNFKIKTNLDKDEDGSESITDGEDPIYIGVIGFHQIVNQFAISNDLEKAKSFIRSQNNDKDFTAFAYSVSKGNSMFDAPDLPEFDKIFMLNFSDGTDNYSNMKWGEEGRMVPSPAVYDTAKFDISKRENLNSYALGFGDDQGFKVQMQKLVMGSGDYYNAQSSSDLQGTFNEIAESIIASAKNVLLKTNPGYFTEEYGKYFRLRFDANGIKDSIDTKMIGNPTDGFTLKIIKGYNNYANFDNPVQGVVNEESGKVELPLNNLKFIVDGEELQFDFDILFSLDNELWYEDVEEASKAESISKRIAVVLVLDCSTSMGEAFEPMKEAAIDFIETLENMDPNAEIGTIRIKFDANGGEGTMPSVTFEQNTYQYIPNNTFTHSTLVFKGWNTKADGSGDSYTNGQYFYANQNMTLYAQWEEGYEYVDLGLSVKWATMNVGATSPEDYGDYFAWGETSPKSSYNSSNYYYSSNPATLPLNKDAANVNWGGDWRMPTKAEQDELRTKCTWTWTTLNGVKGCKVTSKQNGKSIFIPAAGYKDYSSTTDAGVYGDYWSSSRYSNNSSHLFNFNNSGPGEKNFSRYRGLSVRAVLP
ncbi:MAG: InlB B-repeat-containing protein [Paludibacteraceae bacterium]|nr:InlB B-repeat-containing protein [Paludibacteraceae bacterium]